MNEIDKKNPPQPASRAGILTDDEITKYGLISDVSETCLKKATYNLRLGEGHYVFKQAKKRWLFNWRPEWLTKKSLEGWVPVWLDKSKETLEKRNELNPEFTFDDCLTIGPFSAALIQLKETVDTRSCIKNHEIVICGRFDLRLSMVTQGLISQQATQVEPYYKGKLFCYLFNQTAAPIRLNYDDEIATIEFSYVSRAFHNTSLEKIPILKSMELSSKKYLNDDGSNKLFCTEYGIDDIRYFGPNVDGDRKLPDHGSSFTDYIDDKVAGNVNKQLNKKLKWIVGIMLSSISVITILVWLFGNDWAGRYFRGKVKDISATYWKESAPDRDKALQAEINNKMDEEFMKSAADRDKLLRKEINKIIDEELINRKLLKQKGQLNHDK